jgi:hypothetical protein
MSDIGIALLVSIPVTILLAFIQLVSDAERYDLRAYSTLFLFCYIVILCIGNVIAIAFSPVVLDSHLASLATDPSKMPLKGPAWFWYDVAGIFAFEALLKRVNVTIFDKGVLSISDWITKAKNSARAATIQKASTIETREKQQCGRQLYDKYKGSNSIRTFVAQHLPERYTKIEAFITARPTIDAELYLANILANERLDIVKGILQK